VAIYLAIHPRSPGFPGKHSAALLPQSTGTLQCKEVPSSNYYTGPRRIKGGAGGAGGGLDLAASPARRPGFRWRPGSRWRPAGRGRAGRPGGAAAAGAAAATAAGLMRRRCGDGRVVRQQRPVRGGQLRAGSLSIAGLVHWAAGPPWPQLNHYSSAAAPSPSPERAGAGGAPSPSPERAGAGGCPGAV
jgi:hypothetical protein